MQTFQLAAIMASHGGMIPGETFVAIPTPIGNRPTYRLNGNPCFFFLFSAPILEDIQYPPKRQVGVVVRYARFVPMLAILGKAALAATVLLYIKGIMYPTKSDSGTTRNGFIWGIWHGTELHTEICGATLKQIIHCRFAMMGWSLLIVAFALEQQELYGFIYKSMAVSCALRMKYIVVAVTSGMARAWERRFRNYYRLCTTFATQLKLGSYPSRERSLFRRLRRECSCKSRVAQTPCIGIKQAAYYASTYKSSPGPQEFSEDSYVSPHPASKISLKVSLCTRHVMPNAISVTALQRYAVIMLSHSLLDSPRSKEISFLTIKIEIVVLG